MSVQAVIARIEQIQQIGAPQPSAGSTDAADQSGASSFQTALQDAGSTWNGASTSTTTPAAAATTTAASPFGAAGAASTYGASSLTGLTGLAGTTATTGGTVGQRMVALAEQEVGVTEQPPGSNDSPRIAQYRQATAGSGVGPWCAYFQSWLAQQAGAPLGEAGQGFGSVSALDGWAQRTGRAIPAGTQPPQAGDLIVWGSRHVGIVESVGADGSITTLEGNSSNAVSRRHSGADGGGATDYIRLG